jgi:2-phospho-L-lactate guanylyltransferase
MRRPPNIIPTHFGNRSFKKHLDEASKAGARIKVYRSPSLSLDIDSPQDMIRFLRMGGETEAHRFLKGKGIDKRLEKLYFLSLCET